MQDAHNLAWKLAAVEHGHAGADLLDSYERERRPVAQRNAEVSLANALKLIEVPIALGADPDLEVFAANMAATLADADGRAGSSPRSRTRPRTSTCSDCSSATPTSRAEAAAAERARRRHRPVRTYVPSSRPGARLPHGWIRRGGAVCSTLDLIPLDRPVLIAGPTCGADGDLRVGVDFDDPDGWWSTILAMPDTGALLVRPDQHIAARWATTPTDVDVWQQSWNASPPTS